MTRRASRLLAAAVAAVLAIAVSACSGGGSGGSGSGTVEFWSFTGINQGSSVEQYRALRPDVTIALTEVGDTNETAQALTTALAGGQVPDLVLIQADNLPEFAQNPDNFYDLREFGADEIAGDYLDWVWEQAVADNGAVLGVPTDVGGMAIAYRKDLFERAGFPTDRESVSNLWPTWEEFIATGQRYTAATGQPFVDNAPTSVFLQVIGQGNEQYYAADRETLTYDSNPQIRQGFDYALQAIDAGITARLSTFSEGWTAGLAQGAFAAVAAPSWLLEQMRTSAPETAGLWDLAEIPGRFGNWGGSYLAIPRGAENPQGAWEYIRTMQSPEQQLVHYVESGSLPTTPEVYDDPEIASSTDPFFSDAPAGQIYTTSVSGKQPYYIGPDNPIISTEFLNAITAVEQAGAPRDAAWDTALANIRTALGG